MAAPNEKLAASLTSLQTLQRGGRRVFQSNELSRIHRERLLRTGFLQEVIKGWIISASPSARAGDSTPWYASFWEFCARYCEQRFGELWHLSPEQSLLLHSENTVIPKQAVINSPRGTNNKIMTIITNSNEIRNKPTLIPDRKGIFTTSHGFPRREAKAVRELA